MTLHTPVFMQPTTGDPAIDYSAQEFRQYNRAETFAMTGVPGEQGIASLAGMVVTQHGGGANLSVDVAGGLAFVVGDDVTNQGTYQCWNDAVVNVTGITVPGSGTYHHRIVLQVQDKLNNGTWTGYTAAFTALLDTGSGLPAEPNSAITLATIDVPTGSASVTNSMINDYRQMIGPVSAYKGAQLARASNTTLTDDPDLQLLNLQASAKYYVSATVFYNGGSGANEGDIKYTFRTSSGSGGGHKATRLSVPGGSLVASARQAWTDVLASQTTGTSNDWALGFEGAFTTGAAPAYLVFQWAQNTSVTVNTTVEAASAMTARRIA